MKKFYVDVFTYPKSYEVEAENESEAKEKAKQLFQEETGGSSVYSTEVQEA